MRCAPWTVHTSHTTALLAYMFTPGPTHTIHICSCNLGQILAWPNICQLKYLQGQVQRQRWQAWTAEGGVPPRRCLSDLLGRIPYHVTIQILDTVNMAYPRSRCRKDILYIYPFTISILYRVIHVMYNSIQYRLYTVLYT